MDDRAKDLVIKNIPLFNELVETWKTYQVVNVDLNRLIYFLTQFDSLEQISIIISLLKKVEFIDSSKMTYLLKKAYEKVNKDELSSPLYSSLGGIQDSSAVICYQLLKQLFDKEEDILKKIADVNTLGFHLLTNKPSVIFFFDDNITSGTQLLNFFEELILGKDNPEMIKKPLSKEEYEALKNTPIKVCYAIQLDEGCNKIVNDIKDRFKVNLEVYYGKIDYNNYLDFESQTMSSEKEAKYSRDFVRKIAEQLYEDKEWPQDIVYNRLLGYGNLGKLTMFYYNVPKSFIPIFWKFGYYNSKPWIPLFPETQEQKKIVKSNIEFDYYKTELIKVWIDSLPLSRKPELSFGFWKDLEIKEEVTVSLTSKEALLNFIPKSFYNGKIKYESNNPPNQSGIAGIAILTPPMNVYLDDERYELYKRAVDEYNERVNEYYLQCENYLYKLSNCIDLVVRIRNNGNKAATNCLIQLDFNTSEILLNSFENIEQPVFNILKPSKRDFKKSKEDIFTVVPIRYEMPIISNHNKAEPLEENTFYTSKILSNFRLGHNDSHTVTIELTRIDTSLSAIEIPYEINYDEEATTIAGNLIVRINETSEISEKIKEKLFRKIEKLKIS